MEHLSCFNRMNNASKHFSNSKLSDVVGHEYSPIAFEVSIGVSIFRFLLGLYCNGKSR